MDTTDPARRSMPDRHDDSTSVRVELLSAPDCPNVTATRRMLEDCLVELGLAIPVVERVGRYRSPTVLVNGLDVMRPATSDPVDGDLVDGDACRLDLPSRDRVLATINASLTGCRRPLTLDSLRDAARDGTAVRAAALPEPVRRLHRGVLRAFLTTGRAPDRSELHD